MDPLDVELAYDAPRAWARKPEDVNLDHLRHVLEEMRGLRNGEDREERQPRRRNDSGPVPR
jgi:hypothetical protein